MTSHGPAALHTDAVAVLTEWRAPGAEQEALRRRYLSVLDQNPDACSRTCLPEHLTASALIISPDGGQVLLTLHAKAGRWFQFGGHCEAGDATLMRAAERETREESGIGGFTAAGGPIHLSAHDVPFCGGTGDMAGAVHLDVRYVGIGDPDSPVVVSEESHDVRWWPTDGLPNPDPDMLELVSLARARLAQSHG